MRVLGYSDRLSVSPGSTIRFMISCQDASYDAAVMRLYHGDLNPAGPGLKAEVVPSPVNRQYPGREQSLRVGSYVTIPDDGPLRRLRSFSLLCWIYPTTPAGRVQGVLTRWSEEDRRGYGLFLTEEGDLALRLGGSQGEYVELRTTIPLRARTWYFVAATFDAERRLVRVYQQFAKSWPVVESPVLVERQVSLSAPGDANVPFLIAASHTRGGGDRSVVSAHYNGKIDRPRVVGRAFDPAETDAYRSGQAPASGTNTDLLAAWDFSREQGSDQILDTSSSRLHGRAINMPTRAVTGYNWNGHETRFSLAPDQYSAIHFHDDDLEDAGWMVDFELAVPSDWPSGIYAIRLTAGEFEDYVPFIVRPAPGKPTAPIAFLVPTLTYLAYANDHMPTAPGRLLASLGISLDAFLQQATPYEEAVFRYIVDHRLHSLYDYHSDGSAVFYGSRLRPLLNIRPRYNKPNLRFKFPHLLSCDLYLVDWLRGKQYAFDVITDEDLHHEGESLLAPYRVLLTGTHPEYWSEQMLNALEGYLTRGGRLMYLGGNGFYWVTSVDPMRPHIIEVRRGHGGSRSSSAEPGECYHSTTGELGGLWRFRGRFPQSLVGVGFTAACGLDRSQPYRRTAESYNPRVNFIFKGVRDELIGDFGLHMGGAAGWELDRADSKLGTPPHALVVASSFGHSDAYQHVVEELLESDNRQGGTVNPLVRADLTYFEGPNGGAVFSVGSISWCGSLSYNDYTNNVSTITGNVLSAFAAKDGPRPNPEGKGGRDNAD